MIRTAVLVAAIVFCLRAGLALADDAPKAAVSSHEAAVQEMFKVTHMDELMTKTIDAILDQQVKQNPALSRYRHVMSQFFQKYMSWQSLEKEMTEIYVKEFSEEEIKALTAFYRTPLGQKMLTRAPTLMAKGAAIGQERVEKHVDELHRMMADEDTRQK